MSDTREFAEIVEVMEEACAEFGRAAMATIDAYTAAIDVYMAAIERFIMWEEQKTVGELEQEIRRLEHELEIARLEKKVRELKEEIDKQKGCSWELWPPYLPYPRPYPPSAQDPCVQEWPPPVSYASSVTAPSGCYTIYY